MALQYTDDDELFESIFAAIPSEFTIDELTDVYVRTNRRGVKICSALDARTHCRRTYDQYWEYICNSIVSGYAMATFDHLSGCALKATPSEEAIFMDMFIDDFMTWFYDNKDGLQLRGDAVRQLLIGAGIDFDARREQVSNKGPKFLLWDDTGEDPDVFIEQFGIETVTSADDYPEGNLTMYFCRTELLYRIKETTPDFKFYFKN